MSDLPLVVKVREAEFEQFLRAQEYEYWEMEHGQFGQDLAIPLDVDELMDAITTQAAEYEGFIYVFHPYEDPYETANQTNWEEVPEVPATKLEEYIVMSDGRDFLRFDSSPISATNGDPITLLPYNGRYDKADTA